MGNLKGLVEICAVDDQVMDGLLCSVELSRIGDRTIVLTDGHGRRSVRSKARAFINKDHPVVKALLAEPRNQQLLGQILIPAFATEIVKQGALVTCGLFTPSEAKALVERFDGYRLILYVIRHLTDQLVKDEELTGEEISKV